MDCDPRNVDGGGGNGRDLEKLAGDPLGALHRKSPDRASRSRPRRNRSRAGFEQRRATTLGHVRRT
jgi:hypothetical protein